MTKAKDIASTGKLPKSYIPAYWRNTTPVDTQSKSIGIGFDLVDGSIIRLCLDLQSASHLKETINEYMAAYARKHSHLDKSRGMPKRGKEVNDD